MRTRAIVRAAFRRRFRLALAAAWLLGGSLAARAAGAHNAYVSVGCAEASETYAIDGDFYLSLRSSGLSDPKAWVSVSALDPFWLVAPEGGGAVLGSGETCVYRVRDGIGSEDTFAGIVRMVKVDIAADVLNVCAEAGSASLRLTNDSYLGDRVAWSSVPAGIVGRGAAVDFSPFRLAPGAKYTVTARSELFPDCSDTCIVRVVKVELVTPGGDPVSAPSDSGDGQNEFTYSSDSPGVLTMSLKAKVTPSVAAAEVAGACRFRVGSIGVSVREWSPANPSGQAVASGDSLVATVTFTGLPKSNSDFGRKTASITFDGVPCDEREYEVFFPKEARNHPIGQADSPNWFYYWKQGNVCGIPSRCVYADDANYGYVIPREDAILRLGPDAPTTNTGMEIMR